MVPGAIGGESNMDGWPGADDCGGKGCWGEGGGDGGGYPGPIGTDTGGGGIWGGSPMSPPKKSSGGLVGALEASVRSGLTESITVSAPESRNVSESPYPVFPNSSETAIFSLASSLWEPKGKYTVSVPLVGRPDRSVCQDDPLSSESMTTALLIRMCGS